MSKLSAKERTRRRKAEQADLQAQIKANICGAKKRDGRPCKRLAGWGTDHEGSGRCKHHTGSTSIGRVAAATERLSMATPVRVSPGQAMAAVMDLTAGQLLLATQKVAELSDTELFVKRNYDKAADTWEMIPNHWVALQRTLQADLAKFAKMAADAGIAERETVMKEAQTRMIATMMEAVFNELGLDPDQREKLGPAIRKQLPLIEAAGQDDEAEVVDAELVAA